MSPAVYGSELAETPTVYRNTPIEETIFPPISRKSRHTINDEGSEYSKHTRNSVPNSLASSPIKFPTIDRSKSTSVASITGVSTNGSRNRSLSKNRDRRLCRSPSCPSHFEIHRDTRRELTDADYSLFKRDRQETGDQVHTGSPNGIGNDDRNKLPDIFNNNKSDKLHKTSSQKELLPIRSDRSHERSNILGGIRRTDSYQQVYTSNSEFASLTSRDNSEPRTNIQTAALLLPLRENARTEAPHKKKKKHRSRHRNAQDDSLENTQRTVNRSPVRHLSKENLDALDAIAMENGVMDEKGQLSPRAFEINSKKAVQQWLQSGSNHKQGQVKA